MLIVCLLSEEQLVAELGVYKKHRKAQAQIPQPKFFKLKAQAQIPQPKS